MNNNEILQEDIKNVKAESCDSQAQLDLIWRTKSMIITELMQNSEPSKGSVPRDKLHAALDAKNTIVNKLGEAEN